MLCILRASKATISATAGPTALLALAHALVGCTLGQDTYVVRKVSQVLVDGVAVPNAAGADNAETPTYTVGVLRARFLVSGQIQASTQVNSAGALPVVERSPTRNGRLQPLRVAVELVPAAPQTFALVEIDGHLIKPHGVSIAPSKVALGAFPCVPRFRIEAASLTPGEAALRVDRRICVQLEFDAAPDILEVLLLRFGTVRALAVDGTDGSTTPAVRKVELRISPQEVVYVVH